MPTHAEVRRLAYSAEQMYALVADVEKYPEFLPWCIACRISDRTDEKIKAELVVGFKIFRETFVSSVKLHPFEKIDVQYEKGPFQYLNNHWKFIKVDDHHCDVDFYVDFSFQNSFFQHAIEMFFNEAVKIMIHSFEKRAEALYGKSEE